MGRGFFITGTDTDVGKTWVSVALLRYFRHQGYSVAGMKPVAAGCQWRDGRLFNQDALLLQANASPLPVYQQVNPYAFEAAVSPHLAAAGVEVRLETILAAYSELAANADVVLVEGAGGWLSPLAEGLDNAGLAEALQLPVILVVGLRLGCINQARLSFGAIQQSSLRCAGWVAVTLDTGMQQIQGHIDYISQSLDAPLLAVLPYTEVADFDLLAAQFKSVELLT
jgi:dethiobiotin synthetase